MAPIKPIFEFILWDNCNRNCKFCWQKKHYNFQDDIMKAQSISNVLKFIDSSAFIRGSHVLVVGGELFDSTTSSVRHQLMHLFEELSKKQVKGDIDLLYLNTNLMYDVNEFLVPVLKLLRQQGLISKLKFTTSYDIYGRFNDDEHMFFENLALVKSKFQQLNVVVNTILTRQLCNDVLENRKSIVKELSDEYSADVNLLPYISIDDEMTPTTDEVFKTLQLEDQMNPGYIQRYVINFDLPQKKLIYKSEGGILKFRSSDLSECGHGVNFKKYSTRNSCFICDLKEVFNAV